MNSSRIQTITAYLAAAVAHTYSVAKTTMRTTIVAGLAILTMVGSESLYAQDTQPSDLAYEKYRTGWAFYLDNDALTTGDSDEDYTGGFAVTLSGRRATEYPISLDSWLNGLDRFSQFKNLYKDTNYFQRHSFEFGVTLFTPSDISVAEPLPDDHPYASLFFIANAEQTVVPERNVAYQSTFTFGVLGLDIAEDLQESIHDFVDSEEPQGWDNQISSGGELTARYTLSRQKTHSVHYGPTGVGHEFKSALEGSVGFSTDVNAGLSWRWGRINTPWWSFNPHQAEYINLGSPVVGNPKRNSQKEFFLWAGFNVKYRLYNAILQGQFRDSEVEFDRSELEHVIGEAWVGVTKEFSSGFAGSFFVRGRTEEIKGPNERMPVWAGIILSRAY